MPIVILQIHNLFDLLMLTQDSNFRWQNSGPRKPKKIPPLNHPPMSITSLTVLTRMNGSPIQDCDRDETAAAL